MVLTVSGYIFPLITFPYVSRVLGVSNIGICNYVDGIIHYYILFSTLGIASYGVREIAKNSDDFDKCSQVFSSLFSLNAILTVAASIILVISSYTISSLESYKPFLLIGLVKLIANLFLTEWFFQGVQLFKYITIRSLVIRFLYVISLFLFVKKADDVYVYYLLTALVVVVNAVLNWRFSKNYRHFSFKKLNISLIIWPVLVFGYYRILTSMYTTFNVVYLGSQCGNTEVGFFSTATKLYSIIMAVFTAFTTIMVPRVSQMIKQKQITELQSIADKTFSLLERFSIPIIIFCHFFASQIILLLAGTGYEGAIIPFKIVIFLLLVIGMEQITIQQFLMASTSNKSILLVSTVGAFVGLSINLLLTEKLGSIGAAIAWGCSELSVLLIGLSLTRRILHIRLALKPLLINILSAILYVIPLYIICVFCNNWVSFVVGAVLLIVCFFLYNFIVYPEQIIIDGFKTIKIWKKFK